MVGIDGGMLAGFLGMGGGSIEAWRGLHNTKVGIGGCLGVRWEVGGRARKERACCLCTKP